MLISVVLFGTFLCKAFGSYTANRDADGVCTLYKKTCPEGKICAVQQVKLIRNMTFPVCVSIGAHKAKSELCEQPPAPGRCGAQHFRWYFNRHSASCAWFIYTGCRGNSNNFRTKAQCERKCVSSSALAQLVEPKPLVVMAPDEIVTPPKSVSLVIRRVRRKDSRKKRLNIQDSHKKKLSKQERRRLRQEQRRQKKLDRLKRKQRHRMNRRRKEDNLIIRNPSRVSDQARHYIHGKSGQSKKIKLFSILDKYPNYSQS